MKRAIVVAAVLWLAACTSGLDNKLDGTSEQTFQASLAKMRKSAGEAEAKRLDDSLRVLAITDVSIGFEGGILGAYQKIQGKSPDTLGEFLLSQVNGKTGKEIFEAAMARRKEQGGRQLAGVDAEIAKLKKARAEKETAKDFLAKIQIQEPRIVILGDSGNRMAVMTFKVQNDSEEALASVFLRFAVSGEGGAVLMSDEFTYKASPAIAPATVKEVRLPNSTPGRWNTPQLAKVAEPVLALSVENATTAAGTRLATSFTQKDAERLAVLEKVKPQIEALIAGK